MEKHAIRPGQPPPVPVPVAGRPHGSPARPGSQPVRPGPQPLSDQPQFLSAGALQDPTLRTPGSEIPEAMYAASDAVPFEIGSGTLQSGNDDSTIRTSGTCVIVTPDTPVAKDRRLALLMVVLLLAIIAAVAIYVYRDSHRRSQPSSPAPVTSSLRAPAASQSLTPKTPPGFVQRSARINRADRVAAASNR